jgi:hypothetical protein
MKAVRVVIRKHIDDAQPGCRVECSFVDACGREWIFHEEVPIVTNKRLGPESAYPQDGAIACKVLKTYKDLKGIVVARINTDSP